MLPKTRSSPLAQLVAPWWSAACAFQVAWSLVFGAEFLLASFVCMLGILCSLLGLILTADRVKAPLSLREYWLLRAPFSLHAGWIIAASAVNASVLADSWMYQEGTQLALAIVSLAAIFAAVVLFVVAAPKPDAIIGFVAAWWLAAVHAELGSAANLLDPSRFNFFAWDRVSLAGLGRAALVLSWASLGLGLLAAALRILGFASGDLLVFTVVFVVDCCCFCCCCFSERETLRTYIFYIITDICVRFRWCLCSVCTQLYKIWYLSMVLLRVMCCINNAIK
ncbi:unnamed protein product [Polarella glacialis]|uniref:Uncharacterized protein n=1 Tax=Polarella glacialis TaxID=89957 RepID=A0A813IDP6_POLGL|nr:unnamed protein product [Polarella glacialis]